MSELADRYKIPEALDVFIDRGFLVLLAEEPERKTVLFHIPSRLIVDHRGRATNYQLTWIHPEFNAEFCNKFDETPGDLPNFEVEIDVEDVGSEFVDDLETVEDLECWLVDFSNTGYIEGTMRDGATPGQIADEFCRILNDWLKPDEIAEINRRNALPEYRGLCATHDFCDPNQAMIDAGAIFTIEFDARFNEDVALINAAWDIAKGKVGLLETFTENGQWCEVWTGLTADEEVRKMLTLNAGHKPVKTRHQLELLFLNLLPILREGEGHGFTLVREKEISATQFSKRRPSGSFHFAHIITSLLSFYEAKPVGIAVHVHDLHRSINGAMVRQAGLCDPKCNCS